MIQEMLDSWPYFNDHIMKCFLQEDGKRIYENSLKLCKAKFPDLVDEIRGMADGCNLPFEKVVLCHMEANPKYCLVLFKMSNVTLFSCFFLTLTP